MNGPQVISRHFPYLPIEVAVGEQRAEFEAMLDSGFDGDLLVPETFASDRRPDMELRWILADGSRVVTPAYGGLARIGGLSAIAVTVCSLGSEAVIGRGTISRYRVILEHGTQVILEP